MRLICLGFASLLLALPLSAEAGKKKKAPEMPAEPGWFQQEGWMGECYRPANFESLATGPKRVAWQATRDAMIMQWGGGKGDGISFDPVAVEAAETALLAKPERIEEVAAKNLQLCMAAMSGKGGSEWGSWVQGLAAGLTVGECPSPNMSYVLYDYLSINDEWHIPVSVCKGDKVDVHGTDGDYFKLSPDGGWINVAGDASQPASGDLPCTESSCVRGQLLLRFTSIAGQTMIVPVGLQTTFLAPDHGRLEVMINDDSLSDNSWKIEKGLEHHTGIEYRPAEK